MKHNQPTYWYKMSCQELETRTGMCHGLRRIAFYTTVCCVKDCRVEGNARRKEALPDS